MGKKELKITYYLNKEKTEEFLTEAKRSISPKNADNLLDFY